MKTDKTWANDISGVLANIYPDDAKKVEEAINAEYEKVYGHPCDISIINF